MSPNKSKFPKKKSILNASKKNLKKIEGGGRSHWISIAAALEL